ELFGRDLRERGEYALPQLDLAGEDGRGAVGIDADPTVEPAIVLQTSGQSFLPACKLRIEREGDDDRTEAGGEFAPIESGSVHGSRPPVRLGGAQHRANDAVVRAAAAKIASERRAHVRLTRPRIAVEQFLRRHDHAIGAVAALGRLL